MTDDTQDWTRKIAALLRKAEGTDNENEASAFLAKAQDLMIRHAIDEQTIREAAQAAGRPVAEIEKRDVMYSPDGKNAVGKASLFGMAAKANHCRFYKYGGSWNLRREGKLHARWGVLVGFPDDMAAAELLYQSLLIQAFRFGGQAWRDMGDGLGVGQSKFLTGFLMGFAQRIGTRMAEAEQTVASAGTALIARRDAEVADAVHRFFPNMAKGPSYTMDALGYVAGHAAGDRADIGQPKVAAGAARLGAGK